LGFAASRRRGGFRAMMAAHPEQYHVIQGPGESVPFLGMLCLIPAVGVWYACTNQFYIQRCLAARSEWDSRMSVVLAGFLLVAMPFFIVLPGLRPPRFISPADLPGCERHLHDNDSARHPRGVAGIDAGIPGGGHSSGRASALINSTGTIATVDFYERFRKGNPDDRQMVRVGRSTGMAAMLLGVAMACFLASRKGADFRLHSGHVCTRCGALCDPLPCWHSVATANGQTSHPDDRRRGWYRLDCGSICHHSEIHLPRPARS